MGAAHRGASRRAQSVFPACVALVVVVLGSLGVSGSSVALYETNRGVSEQDAGVVAGPPRPIRSDEWLVRTPWVLRQLERDFAKEVPGGVGRHDPSLVYELPGAGWETVLRPQTAAYRFLGPEQAFAMEWWALYAIQLLGVYALVLVLTGRVAISALAASLVTLSPTTQWWTTTATFTTIGFGCGATALALLAYRARTTGGRLALSGAAGVACAAFLSALYPPWQIGTALVVVPTGIASVVPDLLCQERRRRALRSLLVVVPAVALVAGGLFAAFVLSHRDAFEAISGTVYPGHRSAEAPGTTDMRRLFSAAFDWFSAAKQFTLVNETNQSENSSALPLLLPVSVACLALVVRGRLRGSRAVPALVGCLVGSAVMVGWMVVRAFPVEIGRVLALTRVPPSRLMVPFGLAGAVALALLTTHQADSGRRLDRWSLLASVAALAGGLAWEIRNYRVEGVLADLRIAGPLAAVVLVGLALALGRRPVAGLAVLAGFSLWQASLINPLQDGLRPLTHNPLRVAVDAVGRGAPRDAGWIPFAADATVRGTLTAAGVNNLAAVSPYPDRAAWRILDPSGASEELWNRYAHISFAPGAPGSPPAFELRAGDDLMVTIDPCSPAVGQLGARFAVAQGFELPPCARPLRRLPWGDSYLILYRY